MSKETFTNVEVEVDADGIATIVIDLNARNGASSTGKTIIVGSTHGGQKFRDARGNVVNLSVNAYSKP
jgi:hypothetical protein